MKFPSLQSFNLEGMTIRALASPPAAQPLKQSVPGLSQPGSCVNGTKAADSASASNNSLAGYGKTLPTLGLGSSHTRSKSQQVRSPFLSFCPAFLFRLSPALFVRFVIGMFVVGLGLRIGVLDGSYV